MIIKKLNSNDLLLFHGKMANYTHRKSKDKKHIKIGDDNEYEAVSRICFFNKKNGY